MEEKGGLFSETKKPGVMRKGEKGGLKVIANDAK